MKVIEKSERYLSEVFLASLNGDFSLEKVIYAINACNQELMERFKNTKYLNDFISYLSNNQTPKYIYQEFLDFWDVYGEFDEFLMSEVKEKYLILGVIHPVRNCQKENRFLIDKTTIKEIYESNADMVSYLNCQAPEYQSNLKRVIQIQEDFKQKLPKELYDEFIEVCTAYMTMGKIDLQGTYCQGFTTGLRVTVEALYSKETEN